MRRSGVQPHRGMTFLHQPAGMRLGEQRGIVRDEHRRDGPRRGRHRRRTVRNDRRLLGDGRRSGRSSGEGRDAADRRAEGRRQRQADQERSVRQPRKRSDEVPHPAEGDVEERPHELRVELRARTARQLRPCLGRSGGCLVRPNRGDHVVDVSDRDDPAGERDRVTRGAARVPRAVPVLVVVADRVDPFAEPRAQRLDERLAVERMAPQLLPLLIRRPPRLVEDLGVDLQLPDVVKQGRPVEPVEVVRRKTDLAAEACGVAAHTLRVTASDAIVDVERGDELQEDLGSFLRVELAARLPHPHQPGLQALHRSGCEREAETRRRLVGKDERKPEKPAERKQPSGERIERGDDDAREDADAEPPAEEHPQRARRDAGERGQELDERNRREDRHREHREPKRTRSPWVRGPASAAHICRSHAHDFAGPAPAVYPRMEDQSVSSATSETARGAVAQTRRRKIAASA